MGHAMVSNGIPLSKSSMLT